MKNTDLYDLASVTKVTAATLALMKMHSDGNFDLDGNMDITSYFLRIPIKLN